MRDTQVGIKLVDRRVIADVLPLLRESRFALDLELLVLAHRLGYTKIVEAPVRIEERFGSTISLKAVWLLLVDTLGLFVRYSVRHQYDPALRASDRGRKLRRSLAVWRLEAQWDMGDAPGSGTRTVRSSLGILFGLAGLLVVILIVAVISAATLSDNTATTATSTTIGTTTPGAPVTTTPGAGGTSGIPAAAAVADCRSDASDVATALAAYEAATGAYPTPPAPWSAASYPTNFAPLTSATPPGPYLKMPPGDNLYVVLWDSAGHVWVEPPGTFTPSYDAANDTTNASACARVAR